MSFFNKYDILKTMGYKFQKVLLVINDGGAMTILSEYYNTDFNSKKCDTSDEMVYRLEIDKEKSFKKLTKL